MAARSWRERRLLFIAVGLAVLAAAPAVLNGFGVVTPWLAGGAAAAGAAFLVLAGVWQERFRVVASAEHELALEVEGGCLMLTAGTLPRVAQVLDPVVLGIHPASREDEGARRSRGSRSGASERVPVYVPRDIDEELREGLARGGFLLLVGDSTAGKSRAAYEAMLATVPDHVLIAPRDRDAMGAALTLALREPRCVLWLNDLERYLGGGLTRAGIARLLAGTGHHRIILATLRAAEYARLTEGRAEDDERARAADDEAREVLEQTDPLRLSRLFSESEAARARTRTWDRRIADALAHAGTYGIAEYLAAGPDLLREWENAWSANTAAGTRSHPRGAALVAAAVDIRRSGYTSPLPRVLLEAVHARYLEQQGGALLRPETLEEAWSWAGRPRRATAALLQPHGEGHVNVFDYLTDIVQRRKSPDTHVAEPVVRTALSHSSAQDANNMAATAYAQGRYALAEHGWRVALSGMEPEQSEAPAVLAVRNNIALTLQQLGRVAEAETELQTVLRERLRTLGAEHPDTLGSRDDLAFALQELGRLQEAESQCRAVLEARTRALGAEHPDTLNSRNTLALVLRELGRLEEAAAEHEGQLAVAVRKGTTDHPETLLIRNNRASLLRELGRWDEAEAEHRAVLEIRTRDLGPEHPETLTARNDLASALHSLGRLDEAMAEHRAVLESRTELLGPEHPRTLVSRNHFATVLHDLGRSEEAEAEHRAVLAIRTRTLGEEHPRTLTTRDNLAHVLQDLGRMAEAEAEFQTVLEARTHVLGPEHPHTLSSRQDLARMREQRS
ncbi:tetratricopeptide repeat protein [Streptomyces sp. NPDC002104]